MDDGLAELPDLGVHAQPLRDLRHGPILDAAPLPASVHKVPNGRAEVPPSAALGPSPGQPGMITNAYARGAAHEGKSHGRRGQIMALMHPDGTPPFRVRWLEDEHVSVAFPPPDAHLEAPDDVHRAADGATG